jgi:hypothetical protein
MLSVGPAYLVPTIPVRRFTVDEYHQMIQAGILAEDERVELLDGWITPKMPRNPPHDSFITQANRVIGSRLPSGWHVRVQCAVTTPTSEPEPDLAIVPGLDSRYRSHHPTPQEVAFLVEVADSSLAHDRNLKGAVYAAANIRIYWIINLVDIIVEVYTSPTGSGPGASYRRRQDYHVADDLPLDLVGQVIGLIPAAELLT